MNILCRPAREADVDVIADFNCRLASETEDHTLNPQTVREGVRRGVSLTTEVQYFVAEHDQRVIAQLMLTREWSDWRNGWMVWLQSVYVDSQYRRQGVFSQLFDYCCEQVRQDDDAVGIRLYVETDNESAIATYRRHGFTDAGYRVLELPLSREIDLG